MFRSFLLCAAMVFAMVGCHSVTEVTQSKEEYSAALKIVQADAGAALREFAAKMSGSVGAKEGAKLRAEAQSAFAKDMEEAKTALRALKPPLDAMGQHLKALGILEAAEKAGAEAARGAQTLTAESLKALAKTMDQTASELSRVAQQAEPRQ